MEEQKYNFVGFVDFINLVDKRIQSKKFVAGIEDYDLVKSQIIFELAEGIKEDNSVEICNDLFSILEKYTNIKDNY